MDTSDESNVRKRGMPLKVAPQSSVTSIPKDFALASPTIVDVRWDILCSVLKTWTIFII